MPTPEQIARQQIDALLITAGWAVQDCTAYAPTAARGIAQREVLLKSGRCDYLLLVDRTPLRVIEAKRAGTLLAGVAEQSARCAAGWPAFFKVTRHLPSLATAHMRECQIEAVMNLDASLAEDRPRALVQMATGAGKTYTAITTIYRLLRYEGSIGARGEGSVGTT